jgi:hypothetical protein
MPDAEIEAMGKVADALGGLEEGERGRVLRWAAERYGVAIPRMRGGKVDVDDDGDDDDDLDEGREADAGGRSGQNVKFEHFAEFYDATDPKTDPERVLVASYWTQAHLGKTTFGSLELNKLLKDLGHGVTAINKAMIANIKKKPALILQVTRGGSAMQARKKYKVTEAGKKWVLARLG